VEWRKILAKRTVFWPTTTHANSGQRTTSSFNEARLFLIAIREQGRTSVLRLCGVYRQDGR